MPERLLALVGLGCAVLFLTGLYFDLPSLRLTKLVPILALAILVRPGPGDTYARLMASGLVFSALGDLLLEREGLFLSGLLAFLVAHLLYGSAFVFDVRHPSWPRIVPFAAWGAMAWAALRPGLGAMAGPVFAYLLAILAMMWRAWARVGRSPRGSRSALWAGAGALLFGASDTLIAFDRFRAPIPLVRWPIILLYWAGQWSLARSARPFRVW
jgi:uncharacterized membrane protein YhhN